MAKRQRTADATVSTSISPLKRRKTSPVESANTLEPDEFHMRYLDNALLTYGSKENDHSKISLHFAKTLKTNEFNACFNLIERTSRKDYEASSWQWHPKVKRREMKEEEMRYLIVCSDDTSNFEGFLSVMLTHDSTPVVPVLYIYEIHLIAQARRKGLGRHLMALAEDIARKVGVAKVMLTCFKSNTRAREFYMSLGYTADTSSPKDIKTRHKVHKHDYVIMSKDMRERSQDGIGHVDPSVHEIA